MKRLIARPGFCRAMWLQLDVSWQEEKLRFTPQLQRIFKKVLQTHGQAHVESIKRHFFYTFWLEGQHSLKALWTGGREAFPSALLVNASIVLLGLKIQLSGYHMSPTCHWLSPRVKGVIRHVLRLFFFLVSPEKMSEKTDWYLSTI